MSISFVLITFLLQMAVGMVLTVAMLPTSIVDGRFFRSVAFWAWLFTGIALFTLSRTTFHLPEVFGEGAPNAPLRTASTWTFILFGVSCLIFWTWLRWTNRPARAAQIILLALVGLGALVLDSLQFRAVVGPAWVQTVLLPLNFISTALVLGGFLAGMMFGHHYLIETDMPKRLLVTMSWILIAVIALRILAVGATLLLYQSVVRPDVDFLNSLISLQGHGIFFWQRILVGLFIPAIVVGLIWGTARIGSNQSATGIMYVAIAFVFIGELAARYLFLLSGIPL